MGESDHCTAGRVLDDYRTIIASCTLLVEEPLRANTCVTCEEQQYTISLLQLGVSMNVRIIVLEFHKILIWRSILQYHQQRWNVSLSPTPRKASVHTLRSQ